MSSDVAICRVSARSVDMSASNQYAIVTPWGRVGYGLLDAPGRQWMEVDRLTLSPGFD